MVIPASYAYFGGKDVPFPTLFATIQALERRARVVAIVFAAGITVLLIHLALYPWPAVIPDLQDLHTSYAHHHHAVKKARRTAAGRALVVSARHPSVEGPTAGRLSRYSCQREFGSRAVRCRNLRRDWVARQSHRLLSKRPGPADRAFSFRRTLGPWGCCSATRGRRR